MLMLTLDSESSVPAYLQIRDRIVALVNEGTLRPGDRLPPTRALADSIGVHRSTVVRAYDEIRALGFLESRSGSYTTVRHRPRPPATLVSPTGLMEEGLVDWLELARTPIRNTHELESGVSTPSAPEGGVDFARLAIGPSLVPVDDLRRCLKSALVLAGPAALDYADPAGWQPLRETISTRMRSHGVAVSADEILVTSGAQQALDLAVRLLTSSGDRVVVEAPTYSMAHALIRLYDLEPVEIPMREDGMDLDALEDALEQTRVRFVYTMPNFHNPTGVTTDQTHRERLLDICERRRVPIVEDGFEEEMKYFGKAVLPIKSIDARGLVLYVGTFSKVVFPGLRVGWIAASTQAVSLMTAIQHAACLAGNTLTQAAVERFCHRGDLDSHLRRVHRVFRRRLQTMLACLERNLPPEVQWTRPVGGYTVWLTLPDSGLDERAWTDRLAQAGVEVVGGSRFFAKTPSKQHLRLSIACADEEQIAVGCQRLGRVLRAERL